MMYSHVIFKSRCVNRLSKPPRHKPQSVTIPLPPLLPCAPDLHAENIPTKMNGRLRNAQAWWKGWCRSSFALSIISNGYSLPWESSPPPQFQSANHPMAHTHAAFVTTAIQELLDTGAASICTAASPPRCVSPLNVVEQKDKKRLILDLRTVNSYLVIPKFRYEGLPRVAELIRRGDWMFTIDLKSGYHHVDMHPSARPFLGFHFARKTYTFNSLPFGLATAPFVFTQVIKQLAARWRAFGFRLVPYVDDIIFMCATEVDALTCQLQVVTDLQAAGFIINWKKSQLAPSNTARFLGIVIDTQALKFFVPPDREGALRQHLHSLAAQRSTSAVEIARVTGMLASMRPALGPASRAFVQGMLAFINDRPSWRKMRPLTAECRADIQFWLQTLHQINGHDITCPATFSAFLHCDASDTAWGAHVRLIPHGFLQAHAQFPTHLRSTSSTHRELTGILWALGLFADHLRHRHVLVHTDNQAAAFIMQKGGSRRTELTTVCQAIMALMLQNMAKLSISWIPREHNALADALSKLSDPDDYSLTTSTFHAVDSAWGPHSIDLFANRSNTQLPRFCSLLYERDAVAIDAFSISWHGENAYAFPPPSLIPAVLSHAATCRTTFTIIIPEWHSAFWWPLLSPSPRAWHTFVVQSLFLRKGILCLNPGNTTSFNGHGYPNSNMWALRCNFFR